MNANIEIRTKLYRTFQTILLTLVLTAAPRGSYAASGDLDLSFDPGSTVNGPLNAIAVQPDGKVLIGGQFTTVHGAMRSCVARLNADGSNDPTFLGVPGLAGNVYSMPAVNCLVLQSDGKILIGGSFIATNGIIRTNLARLNPDGSLDDTFIVQVAGPGVYDIWGGSVNAICLPGSGKILVAGAFTSVNGVACTSIVRLHADGTLDNTYYTSLGTRFYQPYVNVAALQDDGKIVMAGNFNQVNGTTQNYLARLNADGSPDGSFVSGMGTNDGGTIHSIICQTNGMVLIGGVFSVINGVTHTGIARLNANGSTDESFQATAGWVYAMAVQPDGKVVIGGGYFNGSDRVAGARLNPDGSPDASFTFPLVASGGLVYSIALQSDGRIIFGGGFTAVRNNLVRMNADGSRDDTFINGPTGPNSTVNLLAVQPDQKVVIVGSFSAVSGVARNQLARLNPDGSLDTAFFEGMAGASGSISCLALQDDGKILVAGSFTSINGTARNRIARLSVDGSLDESFLQGLSGPDGSIYCLALQSDGKILVGGTFASVNGTSRGNLARLNADGTLDTAFLQGLAGADTSVYSLVVQNDGRIVTGGGFNFVNGVSRKRVARLNSDGSLDAGFSNNVVGNNVSGLALQGDGKILMGGVFLTSINGWSVTNFARLLPDGSPDTSFCFPGPQQFFESASFKCQRDGKILVATGEHRGGSGRFFRLNVDGSVDGTLFGSQSGPDSGGGCIASQADGKWLIGGSFTAVNQTPRSHVARLTGEFAPPILRGLPPEAIAEAGGEIRLSAQTTGYQPMSYQWFFNGTRLDGCTNRFLDLSSIALGAGGAYTLVVTNPSGAVTSAPVTLSVIPAVPRRPVPAINMQGVAGTSLNLDSTDDLSSPSNWTPLGMVTLTDNSQFYFDLSSPLPPQRFYRTWQPGTSGAVPVLNLQVVPALTLTGNIGDRLRVDCINQFGPTDAWVTLNTVTLTNTSQLYFDTSASRPPQRLYRVVELP